MRRAVITARGAITGLAAIIAAIVAWRLASASRRALLAVGAAAGAFNQPAYAYPSYGAPVYHQPAYYGYGAPQPLYYRQPVCRVRYQTVWDPYYGYVQQPVQVCR